MAKTISCFNKILIDPNAAPNESEPVSPINTIAGGALYHKKPSAEPIIAAHNTVSSPAPGK